jgi:hypothetical protein
MIEKNLIVLLYSLKLTKEENNNGKSQEANKEGKREESSISKIPSNEEENWT